MDVVYHYLFWVSISCGSTIDCINEQFIVCGCFLSVDCSASSGYGCCISLDTIENYLILRAVVLTYIYDVSFATPPRAVAVAPRWVSGLPTQRCILWCKCSLWWRWLTTTPQCSILLHLEHLESHVGQFALPGGCCHVQLGQSLASAGGV